MRIHLPVLSQEFKDNKIISNESQEIFTIDTSVYSEERWEQHFPALAAKEGLFQYIERIQKTSLTERVRVACMLKAIFCFIESDCLSSYKEFAQLFNLAAPEYTDRLISSLHAAFEAILGGSSVKN